jgi:sugar (pentulose or hexulose) kinase
VFADLAEATEAVTREPRYFAPDAEAHAIYDEAYARWRGLTDHLLEAADSGLTPYLWRGAW